MAVSPTELSPPRFHGLSLCSGFGGLDLGLSLAAPPPSHTELFVTLSGRPTPRPSSWRGWRTRPWIRLLSGTKLKHSTAARGGALWISSLQDIPANPTQQPDCNAALMILGISGRKFTESSQKSPLPFCFSKTYLTICKLNFPTSSETWSHLVTELRRDCSLRQRSARRIGENGYSPSLFGPIPNQRAKKSNWATPTARDYKDGGTSLKNVRVNGLLGRQVLAELTIGQSTSEQSRMLNPRFTEALMGLPPGWTGFDSVETEWFRWLRQMRSELSLQN